MNNFNLVSKILTEAEVGQVQQPSVQPVQQSVNIKNDPAVIHIKKKAEVVSAKADLMSAQNKIRKVKNDREKIDAERQEHNKEMEAKAASATQPAPVQIGKGTI